MLPRLTGNIKNSITCSLVPQFKLILSKPPEKHQNFFSLFKIFIILCVEYLICLKFRVLFKYIGFFTACFRWLFLFWKKISNFTLRSFFIYLNKFLTFYFGFSFSSSAFSSMQTKFSTYWKSFFSMTSIIFERNSFSVHINTIPLLISFLSSIYNNS